MPPDDLPDPIFITQCADLHKLAETLSRQPIVAVDTEANSLFAYHERVCLIQFSIPGTDYLVDPLALDDLSPLAPLFENPDIEKIFHAAEYDLIVMQHDFGFSFGRLFDTMVAARILGLPAVGLGSLLKSRFGVNPDKKYQRANWGRRPLPADMLTYAQLDTHYLIPLRDHLKAELKAVGRWQLALEDFRRACHINSSPHKKLPPEQCWRINGIHDLEHQQIAVLHELCRFRDQKARSLDRPLFKVIGDRSLFNIAAACPRTLRDLERVPAISQRQVRWIGKELLSSVQRGLRTKSPSQPRKPRPSDQYLTRVDRLRYWRKTTARDLGVESDVILPKDVLYALAEQNPRTREKLAALMQTIPWRLETFGNEIYKLLMVLN
ncbi:MAG: HRDC domain-containing protein [Chloroflexi bacterium]|nr:HRDC domain-containing protein [Chloroflexota bacterium]